MISPYFKVSVRLDEVTPLEPNQDGYARANTDTVGDLTIVGGSAEEVLRQAYQHVGLLVAAHTPAEVTTR